MNAVVSNATLPNFYQNGFHYSPTNYSFTNDSIKPNIDNVQVRFLLKNATSRQPKEMTQIGSIKKEVVVEKDKLGTREVRKKHHNKDKGHHYHDHDHDHHHHGGHGGHHHHEKACSHKHGKGENKHKKFLYPMMFGLLTAKALMLPIILKGVALLSAKGLILGLVATIMASLLSLKKMVEPQHVYHEKKDDITKIEVIPVPVQDSYHHHRSNNYADVTGEEEYHPYHGYY